MTEHASLNAVDTESATRITHQPVFERRASVLDGMITEFGRAMHVLSRSALATRPNPAGRKTEADENLSPEEARHVSGLMRVNHVGEVCAQALYRGQAMFCKDEQVQELLYEAATEEVDHLVWCDDRLKELQSRPSVFNPFWYAASFGLGVVASRAGIPYNLGFMAETERQVEKHLDEHLKELPQHDLRSRKIVAQMRDDEIQHRTTAEDNGATKLPAPVKLAMRFMSKVMTTTAYRL